MVPPKECRWSSAATHLPVLPPVAHACCFCLLSKKRSKRDEQEKKHATQTVQEGREYPPETRDTPSAAPSASSAVLPAAHPAGLTRRWPVLDDPRPVSGGSPTDSCGL